MSQPNRLVVLGLVCTAAVIALGFWLVTLDKAPQPVPPAPAKAGADPGVDEVVPQDPLIQVAAPRLTNNVEIFIDKGQIADAGVVLANNYTGEIKDSNSLQELQAAVQQRGTAGLAALRADLAQIEKSPDGQQLLISKLNFQIGTLLMYEGQFGDAATAIEKSLKIETPEKLPDDVRLNLTAMLGILSLRRGEVENCIGCVGPSSCILPITRAAMHIKPTGSRQAIKYFTEYLESAPGDLRVRWVLNLAYMTLGEYPDKVPPKYLIPLDTLASAADVGRFQNVAPDVGLISRGPNQAGGSVFDDFTGDGLPDLFVTSLDVDRGASLFVNRGDGKFEDQSDKAGLADQVYALNVVRADYDNDGNLDVILLRGGWEKAMRMSLLRNLGNAKFEDVTIASGMSEPIASETAAWGDYDNDGLVDLFVGGEFLPPFPVGDKFQPAARNRSRLYHNEGNGKFVDVAAKLGVAEDQCTKGCAWGDYDADGRLDLFVSNMNAPCRLFHQEPDGTFIDVAPKLKVTGPTRGFACWFWDYNNDGHLDLYVNDYTSTLAEFVAVSLKMPLKKHSSPRLYRNLGADGFRDVTIEVGLDRDMMPMGCNFADIDNDGFLDVYFGTGRMALEVLVPNLMFKNDLGRKFLDITTSSGTGHLQKGHGISFADWNCDGNVDLFVEAGGAVPGDKAYNILFQNPDHGNHWLKVKLTGTKTNRAALGAQVKAVLKDKDGKERFIHRTIGNNGSFGGNTLVESLGLLDATTVTELQVTWPTSKTTQTFRDIPADQAIEITEGAAAHQPLPQKKVQIPPK